MEAYCQRVGAQRDSVRFLFDGERITPNQTPADVRLRLRFVVCVLDVARCVGLTKAFDVNSWTWKTKMKSMPW